MDMFWKSTSQLILYDFVTGYLRLGMFVSQALQAACLGCSPVDFAQRRNLPSRPSMVGRWGAAEGLTHHRGSSRNGGCTNLYQPTVSSMILKIRINCIVFC